MTPRAFVDLYDINQDTQQKVQKIAEVRKKNVKKAYNVKRYRQLQTTKQMRTSISPR